MKHDFRIRHLMGACFVFVAVSSLLLAPQAAVLAEISPTVPLLHTIWLNLLLAGLASLFWLKLLSNRGVFSGRPLLISLAHLPLIALWWPALVLRSDGWPRFWVPVVVALTALLVAWATRVRHRWRTGAALCAVVVIASLASGTLAAGPIDGTFSAAAAALWGLVLMASMIGWGTGLSRVLLPDAGLDTGQKMALGLTGTVAVGGVLNLLWAVSHTMVLVHVGAGVLLWLVNVQWKGLLTKEGRASLQRGLGEPVAVLLTVAVVGLVGLLYAASIAGSVDIMVDTPSFDLHDDCQAYLVFPEKMLQLGSLGAEPFEPRRMLTMGGQCFLQALVLVALPLRTLHLLDAGIAMVLLVLLMAGAARHWGIGRPATLLILLVAVANPHLAMRGNSSALLIGTVFIVAWYRLLSENVLAARPGYGNAIVLALHAAGLCALKPTLIPAAVIIFAVSASITVVRSPDRRKQLREVWLTAMIVVLLIMPWMVSVYCSSATLMYPILGSGFYGGGNAQNVSALLADVGPLETSAADVMLALRRCAAPLAPLLILLFVPRIGRRGAAVAVTAAAVLTVVLLVVMGDPHLVRSLSRYAYPVATAALLVVLLRCMHDRPAAGSAVVSPAVVAAALVALSHLLIVWDGAVVYRRTMEGIEAAAAGLPVVTGHEQRSMAEVQRALPPGATVLETLKYPFLLDFSRQRVVLMSLPAMSGLPPGLPVTEGGEAVAEYLLDRSIRYVAYGGRRSLQDLLTVTEARINFAYPRSRTRWTMLRGHQRYREVVTELADSRKRLYSDGSTVVLDLSQPVTTIAPEERQDDIHGFVDEVWTNGDATINKIACEHVGAFLVLSTWGWHPVTEGPRPPEVRVLADGHELHFLRRTGHRLLYSIPNEVGRISSLRIVSTTRETTIAGTGRVGPRVGVDLRAVEIFDHPALADVPIRSAEVPPTTLAPFARRHRGAQ